MIPTRAEQSACPKCGHPRVPAGESCSRCGLVYARWKPEAAESVVVVALDATGERLWSEVTDDWRNDEKHDAFAKHCSVTGTLAAAGRRYRAHLDIAPGDSKAASMQARIIAMASVQLPARANVPAEPINRSRWFWAVIFLAAVAGILGGLIWGR